MVCESPDFCFDCLEEWVGDEEDRCVSEVCKMKRELVATAPLTRSFQLYEEDTGELITVMAPSCRACPNCGIIVESSDGCKHTPCACRGFEYTFCYVCLALETDEEWPCGSFSQYCGLVAPNQTFD